MLVTRETSQQAMAPYFAVAEAAVELYSVTAVCREALSAKVWPVQAGGGEDSGGGDGGGGEGDGGLGDGGGGEGDGGLGDGGGGLGDGGLGDGGGGLGDGGLGNGGGGEGDGGLGDGGGGEGEAHVTSIPPGFHPSRPADCHLLAYSGQCGVLPLCRPAVTLAWF